ncbi:hypothetical protein, partial [Lacticaseibacillus sp. N501-2]|uniref:hypothetical protein n=1 Tax=Lacticaseibacillus salsurae TaxID=3367729 RepID=UPI0038B38AD3
SDCRNVSLHQLLSVKLKNLTVMNSHYKDLLYLRIARAYTYATRSIQEVSVLLVNFFADLGQFFRRVVSKTSHYLVKLYAVFS